MNTAKIINYLNNIIKTTKQSMKNDNVRTRDRNIKLNDVIYSRFLYTSLKHTKSTIISNINYIYNECKLERTCMYRKDNNIF